MCVSRNGQTMDSKRVSTAAVTNERNADKDESHLPSTLDVPGSKFAILEKHPSLTEIKFDASMDTKNEEKNICTVHPGTCLQRPEAISTGIYRCRGMPQVQCLRCHPFYSTSSSISTLPSASAIPGLVRHTYSVCGSA